MMNVLEVPSFPECSSGCESGWTLYLEHSTSNFSVGNKRRSFGGENQQQHQLKKMATFDQDNGFFDDDDEQVDDDDQEEDLSMVSDASSGPPHFDHDLDEDDQLHLCYNNINNIYSSSNNNNNNNNNNNTNNGDGRLRKRSMKPYEYETQCCSNTEDGVDFALDDTASSHVFTSSNKKIGGVVHVQNQGASFERLIDTYPSSQGCSANQVQGISNYHEGYGFIQSSYTTKGLHQQWAN